MNEWKNSSFEVVVTTYGRNKNRDDEIKNQEKANNSPSYRCAAINKWKLDEGTSALMSWWKIGPELQFQGCG